MVELMTMPKYEAYKDSGEGWISEVPKHWEVKKLKHIFFEKKHTQNMSLNCGSISFSKVVTKDDDKIPHSTKASYQEVLNGEFLINPLNLNYDLISLRIGLSKIDVVVSAGYIVLKNKVNMSKEYFKYLLHRYDVAYMKLLGSGVRQTINFNHIANSLLLVPPMPEQTAIANFLDKKTAQIDEAIAIKEKQIELLKERRQIIIQQAVTQGLNPDAPMKDSGVDWVGQVPKAWEVTKLGFISKIGNGCTPSRASIPFWKDGVIPWLNSSKVNDGIITVADQFVTQRAVRDCHLPLIEPGSLVMAITGEGKTRGMVAISKIKTTINQHLAYIEVNESKINPLFVLVYLRGMYSQIRGDSSGLGSTKGAITCGDLKKYPIPKPPMNEQAEIVTYIESETKKTEVAIDLQIQQIEKLKEYKTTLINSAVTGKIKVPEVDLEIN
ncbi:restriction endonuclease subunit S [Pseudoalteromonas distincta]|uniref:restriction endonuclease subunit S n=1 Tax=Pseudoalteromonas distincta TaxID=77608 RepID=UPI00233FFF7C|nr:restriction endonuclease subunit S [Pseudoalteromonas distincta]MDC3214423.1 restriction endonuclease subunit S [Pseudoalteromonas distincta]